MIDTIMLFAAGLGNRMRHLTENSPKTLLPILGKPILHHALELCKSYPFKKIVINTHYLSKQVKESIEEFKKANPDMPEIVVVYEEELLETGGAIPADGVSIVEPGAGYNTAPAVTASDGSGAVFETEVNRFGEVVDVIVKGGHPLTESTPTTSTAFVFEGLFTS